jgi:hypothetical protein
MFPTKQREKRETSEGKLDKNGNLLKFSRDLESDWIVKNDKPHYGMNYPAASSGVSSPELSFFATSEGELYPTRLKEHASVDVDHGFVLSTDLTPASVSDSIYLPHCIAASCHTEDPFKGVYDKHFPHDEGPSPVIFTLSPPLRA